MIGMSEAALRSKRAKFATSLAMGVVIAVLEIDGEMALAGTLSVSGTPVGTTKTPSIPTSPQTLQTTFPGAASGPYGYDTGWFEVSQTGNYTFTSTTSSTVQTTWFLTGLFSPNSQSLLTPTANFFAGYFDNHSPGVAIFSSLALTAQTQYSYLVAYGQNQGSFTLTGSGPGQICLGYICNVIDTHLPYYDQNSAAAQSATIAFYGGTLRPTASVTLGAPVTLNTGGGYIDTSAAAITTLSGTVSGSGALTKLGAGTLVLSGANTYSGGTTISAGTISVTNSSITGSTITSSSIGTGTLTLDGGTLQAGVGGLTFLNKISINGTGGTIDTNGNLITLAGTISNGNAATGLLTKIGAGTLVLSGANTYSGGTKISAGTISVTNSSITGSTITSSSIGTGTLTLDGGTLQAGVGGLKFLNSILVNDSGGTIDAASKVITLAGNITNGNATTGGLTILDSAGSAGVVVLSGTNSYSGPTLVQSGSL